MSAPAPNEPVDPRTERLKKALRALEDMRQRLAGLERERAEPLAVIGLGCRFPGGAHDPESYWRLLCDGVDAVTDVPPERWDNDAYYDPDPDAPGKVYCRQAAFCGAVDRFDAHFFGISPREAAAVDPQHRLLLETAWEALERAGEVRERAAGSDTGVFVGITTSDYAQLLRDHRAREAQGAYFMTGNTLNAAAGRLAFTLGLHGPAVSIDTACSSSLVALHLACSSLRLGDCRQALVCGVNLMLSPEPNITLCRARMLAPDGRSKTFDDRGDGYGRGEGCGAVLIKRLSHALADGNPIWALIRGSGANQDGPSSGLTVPHGPSQQALMRRVLAEAGVDPAAVAYLEAHGTGTSLGDPIEVESVAAVYGVARPRPLLIASAKTNIGHLEAAAGVAGLIKTVLAVHHGRIPAHLHLRRPNRHIPWDTLNVRVPGATEDWPAEAHPRLAAIDSFGASGTNAHALVEQPPAAAPRPPRPERPAHLLVLSGRTRPALEELARAHAAHLRARPELDTGDVCYTAAVGRGHFEHRLALVGRGPEELAARLEAWAAEGGAAATPTSPPRVAFLFTGQGAQASGMGRELHDTQPVFRSALERCAAVFDAHSDIALTALLFDPAHAEALDHTRYTQPALFALEFALAELWRHWGVRPALVLGHSVGEYVAACVAGVLSPEAALRLVMRRAQLMGALPDGGGMLSIEAGEAEVRALLEAHAPALDVAGLNAPHSTVVAGALESLEVLEAALAARGLRRRRLKVSHAFHSALMDPVLESFRAAFDGVTLTPPRIDLVSNLTGALAGDEITRAEYWVRHTRAPVRFAQGVATLVERGAAVVLELGPAPVLAGLARQVAGDEGRRWLPSLRPGRPETQQMLESLGQLYCAGVPLDWRAYDRPFARRMVVLPTYPFQRERHWFEAGEAAPAPLAAGRDAEPSPAEWFYDVAWREQPRDPVAAAAPPGRHVLFLERGPLAASLAERLVAQGEQVVLVHPEPGATPDAEGVHVLAPGDTGGLRRLLDTLGAGGTPWRSLVFGWERALDGDRLDADDPLAEGGYLGCEPVAALVRALGDGVLGEARLFLLAGLAPGAREDAPPAPVLWQSGFWGLAGCLAQEHPQHWGGLALIAHTPPGEDLDGLCAQLRRPDGEDRVAWVGGRRLVARLVRRPTPAAGGAALCDPGASYLVTGGLGGLGLNAAQWLVEQGARHLVLAGRSPAGPEALDRIAALEAQGCRVTALALDVGSRDALEHLCDEQQRRGLPLRGVVHAAGVLRDATLRSLTREQLRQVLAPKVLGALNLCALARGRQLSWLVWFSSIAGVVGSAGQAGYAAANSFMDALAREQAEAGLPVTSIAWGPWAGAGMTARLEQRRRERLLAEGSTLIDAPRGAQALEQALRSGRPRHVVWAVDWRRLAESLGPEARPALLAELLPPAQRPPAQGAALRAALAAAPEYERAPRVRALVAAEVGRVLGYAPDAHIDPQRGLFELGLDSLMATELRNRLQAALDEALPATLAFEHASIQALGDHLCARLQLDAPRAAARAVPVRGAPKGAGEPVAIIGMACRFPGGADTPARFWELLASGTDAVSDIPAARWALEQFYDPTPGVPGKIYTRKGAFLDDPELFDCRFFGIAPREAAAMDPQQRLLLTLSWEALEDAALPWTSLRGSRSGVFVGIGQHDYTFVQARRNDPALIDVYSGTGNAFCFAPGRIAHVLGLQGPAVALDTACSSSLVALHDACTSLRMGECDLALAGGVQLMLSPESFIFLSMSRALAPDGRSKAFDAAADGFGRGEGCAVLVLKRLDDARRDGDHVWAVIRGSAVNHDGPSSGLTVPNGEAQTKLIRAALAAAGVEPGRVDYVEAHGTGTALGDPIEVRALAEALASGRPRERPLVIGSVKTNIGHLEAAAGLAGLIKVVLALRAGVIPPHLHFTRPSPHIDWDALAVRVPAQALPWTRDGAPRLAGVSSFGLSGTNAHVIVEEAPEPPPRPPAGARPVHVLTLSARSEPALRALAGRWATHLEAHPALDPADVCFSAAARAHHEQRLSAAVRNLPEMLDVLRAAADGRPQARLVRGTRPAAQAPRIVFLFTGQGAQYRGMGRELYATQPAFRRRLDECAEILRPHLERPLTELLFAPELGAGGEDPLDQTGVTQPALLALECALVELLAGWGVRPAAVAGHSVGEYAAAWAAGVLSLEDALRLVARRAALMQALPPGGAMAALLTGETQVRALLDALGSDVEVAGLNGPRNTVVAGPRPQLEQLAAGCAARGIELRWLRVSHAFHSRLMDPVLPGLAAAVAEARFAPPVLELPTNLTGAPAPERLATPEYWVAQARGCVRFEAAVAHLGRAGYEVFLEIGPQPTLLSLARQTLPEPGRQWIACLRRSGGGDWDHLADALARLYAAGVEIDWAGFDAERAPRRLPLPTYAFEGRRLWLDTGREPRPPVTAVEAAPTPLMGWLESGDLAGLHDEARRQGADAPAVLHGLDTVIDLHHAGARERLARRGLYRVAWNPLHAAAGAPGGPPGVWLLFVDQGGVCDSLAQRLEQRGGRCLRVRAGDVAQPVLADVATLAPHIAGHHEALVPWLAERAPAARLKGVVYGWGLDVAGPGAGGAAAVDASLALLLWARAAARLPLDRPRALWLLTRGTQPAGGHAPGEAGLAQTPLWGAAPTLSMEWPEAWGGCVDLSARPDEDELEQLAERLDSTAADEDQLALRGRQVYVPRLTPFTPEPQAATGWRPHGSWLITGGLGALGLQSARWLAARGARELLLVGRRPPHEAAAATVRLIEGLGARVSVAALDITEPAALQELLALRRREGRPVTGVIHAAGVLGYEPLERLEADGVRRVMGAKLRGGWLLHQALGDDELEAFVGYSSISAVWGSKGQAHYAAANAFLDGLAWLRTSQGRPGLSLAWGPWAGGGMTGGEAGRLYTAMGLHALHPRAAAPLLGTLAACAGGSYVAAELDWRAFLPVVEARRARPFFALCAAAAPEAASTPAGSAAESPAAAARWTALPADERAPALRALVAEQAARSLGITADQIDPEQGFFALGMDSIMVVELVEALRRETGLTLSHAAVFEHACVAQLAGYLLERLAPPDAAREPAPAAPSAAALSESAAAERAAAEVLALDDEQLRAFINAEVESVLRGE